MFYPEMQYVDVRGADGSIASIARGIPWQLFLYHTGYGGPGGPAAAGDWVLEDLMSAEKRPRNR